MIQKYFDEKIIQYHEILGHFNKNYKVETKSGFYHLKILKDDSFEIKKWIDGTTIKTWNETSIMFVCKAIKKVHKQKLMWTKMDYQKLNIKDPKYNLLIEKYKNRYFVPCHNDLNKDNIIIDKSQAYLIDFEFKRLNNKHWDIANIINEDNLNHKHIQMFLKHYRELNPKTLNDFIYINKIFVKNWKEKYF